jgi:hypothetical protein
MVLVGRFLKAQMDADTKSFSASVYPRLPLRLCALWFSGLTFLALLRSWPFRKIGIENQPSAVNVC